MVLTGILIFIILAATGALVKYGRQHWLIAGYNTMPKDKQEKVDVTGLASFMGNGLFGIGALALVGSLITSRWCPSLFPYILILCTAGTVLMVLGTQKFNHNKRSRGERTVLIAVLAFTATVLIAAAGLMIRGHRSSGVEIKPEGIVIGGMYGAAIAGDEITGIELLNEIPAIISRNNGFSSGEVRKGHFTLEGMGRGRLYLESNRGPSVCIFTRDSYVIISYKDPARTEALYQSLQGGLDIPN